MKHFLLFIWAISSYVKNSASLEQYRERIIFSVFSESYPDGTVTYINDTLEKFNCDLGGNTTFIVHGWLESIDRPWVKPMINEFLKLRGNCVLFMDYSVHGVGAYSTLTPHFNQIADILVEKILKISVPEKLVMFGFSFGARLAIKSGILIGGSAVDKIYACDPAGPGFDPFSQIDPTQSAKFVSCIHTSNTYGTRVYNCHQDWRMGICGQRQVGARAFPYGSHGLCPYFFLASFTENFVQKNTHRCRSRRIAKDLPSDLIMGPRELRLNYIGDIFAPTARNPPWSGYSLNTRIANSSFDFYDETDTLGEDYYNDLLLN